MVKNRRSSVNTVLILLLFCLFAGSVLLALLSGAGAYRSMQTQADDAYFRRTGLSYIAEKVRGGDSSGGVYVGDFHGISALYIDDTYEEIEYSTVIYVYDGWLCELFSEKGLQFEPGDGNRIIEAESVAFEYIEPGIIRAEAAKGDGGKASIEIALRSAPAEEGGQS